MDWKLSFNPNDLSNMTRAQMARKVNPKIVLTIRVGRGMVGAGIPILLEDMSLSGLMKIRLKLINTFPHIKTMDISFLEEPKIDYVLKPIGGETFGFDISNVCHSSNTSLLLIAYIYLLYALYTCICVCVRFDLLDSWVAFLHKRSSSCYFKTNDV